MGRSDQTGWDASDSPPGDIVEFGGPPGGSRRWRRWIPITLVIAAAAGIAAYATSGGQPSATPSPTSTPPAVTPSALPAITTPTSAPAPYAIEYGRPILGITGGWELFGQGPNWMVRIQFAAGRVTRTAMPALQSSGGVALIVGNDWAVIRPLDYVPGYVVRDGRPAAPLTGSLDDGGIALAGPDNMGVWFSQDVQPTSMILVGVDGRRTGTSMKMPRGTQVVWPDGNGYVVAEPSSGAYLVRPDGSQRITPGTLLAIGPRYWLVRGCSACLPTLIDRTTGRSRLLGGGVFALSNVWTRTGPPSMISPDGRYLAAYEQASPTGDPAATMHLIDVASGADRLIDAPLGRIVDPEMTAWSPDGRWLFAIGEAGRLFAINAATGNVDDFGTLLPALTTLTVRNAGAAGGHG